MSLIREQNPTLGTVADVIDALGGNEAVYAIAEATPQSVSNWRDRGQFPAALHQLFTDALRAKRRKADPKLWGQKQAAAKLRRAAR